MMTGLEDEPAGWRELCEKLRTAKDAEEFQRILDQIDQLLTAHEKAHPEHPAIKQTNKLCLPTGQ